MFSRKFVTVSLVLVFCSVANGTGTRGCTNKITKFQTYDPYSKKTTDLVVTTGVPTPIDFDWFLRCELTIMAVAENAPSSCKVPPVKCVELSLGDETRKDAGPPYTLYGETGANSNIWWYGRPDFGIQTLKACPYTDSGCTEGKGTCLELVVDMKDYYIPNLVLYDTALGYNGRIDYIYDGKEICLPKSGQVSMIANVGCYTDKVDFELTGGGRMDKRTDYSSPFWLYGDSGVYGSGGVYGRDGFKFGTEYTVTAIPDNDASRKIERHFTFKSC